MFMFNNLFTLLCGICEIVVNASWNYYCKSLKAIEKTAQISELDMGNFIDERFQLGLKGLCWET
jgi:hypothetical protein